MAKIRVTKDLRNFEKYTEGLKNIDPIVKVASFRLQGDLLTAWAKGSNLSNRKKNKKLSEGYKETKEDSGRNGVRDLNYTGKMTQSMASKRDGFARYSVGPRGNDEQAKMEGNIGYDENIMKIGDKARNKIIDFVNKKLKNGGK